jgi:hypothetical protein
MRFQILIFSTILILTIILTGCPTATPTNNNSTNTPTNAANTSGNSNSPLETIKKTPEQTTNEAPTLKPFFKAYCDAMTRKDEAAVRKVFSQATLKQFEADMKSDNEKSLVKHLEADNVSNKLCEIRNEKIEGDRAVAEGRTEGAPNGFKYVFVKENGEWKLTTESPELDSVKKSASNSNTSAPKNPDKVEK